MRFGLRYSGMQAQLKFRRLFAAGLITLITALPASAQITITEARYAGGVTVIRGVPGLPPRRVTLDRRYRTRTNDVGQFTFRVRYLPNDCVADLRAGNEVHPVTITNCFLKRGARPPRM